MKSLLHLLVILTWSTLVCSASAQEPERYSWSHSSQSFRDGIYKNIDMVKKNFPIPSNWIVTDMDVRDPDFFKKVTRADELVYYDDNGVRSILETSSVWGYSYKGDLYINLGGAFHKIDFFGRISFFKAAKTTYYSNPLMGAYHTLDFWSTAPILVTARNAEYLVDIDENKVWEFTVPGLEYVLKSDSVLWNEFASLREREKEDMKYIFLSRYNKKYPLTIPFD